MLRISLQTLRARRGGLAGAFVALAVAVTVAYATGLLLAGALGAPGPGRLAAADAVVRADPGVTYGHGEDAETVDAVPAPRLSEASVDAVARIPGVAHAVGDVAFPVGVRDGHGRALDGDALVRGHGWPSAALTPYVLRAGEAPAGPRDVVADARLGARVGTELRVTAPGGSATYRVTGVADGAAARDRSQTALFFAPETAGRLSGAPGRVGAIGVIAADGTAPAALRDRLQDRLGDGVEVLGADHAADADAGDPRAADRVGLIAVFGTMGGIAGIVALFVVAGTFSLVIAQRRRENAVLRALGATPRQVRRLVSGEALLVSLAAAAVGVLAGRPLAHAIADVLADHGAAPQGFTLGSAGIPLLAAVGGGIAVAQLAVLAAARRAGRVRPAEALREAAIEPDRIGVGRALLGLVCLAGGGAMALLFSGEAALAFAVLGGMLLAAGTAWLGRWLLGLPAVALSLPLRLLGAPGFLAGASLAANRRRTAALATPIVLIAMLVGTQGVLQASDQHKTEDVTAARTVADQVVTGRDGAPLPAGTAAALAGLHGVDRTAAMLGTDVFLLDDGLGWDTPWPAAGLNGEVRGVLDLRVTDGSLAAVSGDRVAVSDVVAEEGGLHVGDPLHVRMADTRPGTLRVAAVYERAAGLGDVVMDPALARRHAADLADDAVFVAGGPQAARSLAAYARTHPDVAAMSRDEYLGTLHAEGDEQAWAVWLVIGLSIAFAALALVNTAAMTTAERARELATIRLLGGTTGQAMRMIALELGTVLAVALLAGGAIAAVAISGVPEGVRGIPLVVPAAVVAGLLAGTAAFGLAAGAVSARFAARATPAAAMRAQE